MPQYLVRLICFSVWVCLIDPNLNRVDRTWFGSLSTPSAIDQLNSQFSSNIRNDPYDTLLKVLQEKDTELFKQELIKATDSELDYLVFITTLNQLISEDHALRESLHYFIKEMSAIRDLTIIEMAPQLTLLFDRPLQKILNHSHVSRDRRLYFFNLAEKPYFSPATREEGDFQVSFLNEVVEELLLANEKTFLVDSVQDAIKPEPIGLEEISFPRDGSNYISIMLERENLKKILYLLFRLSKTI